MMGKIMDIHQYTPRIRLNVNYVCKDVVLASVTEFCPLSSCLICMVVQISIKVHLC